MAKKKPRAGLDKNQFSRFAEAEVKLTIDGDNLDKITDVFIEDDSGLVTWVVDTIDPKQTKLVITAHHDDFQFDGDEKDVTDIDSAITITMVSDPTPVQMTEPVTYS